MRKAFLITILLIGVVGLYLEQQPVYLGTHTWIIPVIDYTLVAVLLAESVAAFLGTPRKRTYLRSHLPSFLFLIIYLALFTTNRLLARITLEPEGPFKGYLFLMVVRNLMLMLKVYGRMRKLRGYLNSIFTKPAQTVVLSFVLVILVGTLLLMMPPMNADGHIKPVNALFTVTSAVCVTGLIVVDTAVDFTLMGQITIMGLIQIGGLGIMLLSYFLVFAFRRSVSLKDRKLLSYMLNASDMKSIVKSVKRIIFLTFSIEAGASVLLFPIFLDRGLSPGTAAFHSLFHAVSAFCNAGFALYSDSLMSFRGNLGLNFVIAGLIIAGGISFTVLTELSGAVRSFFRRGRSSLSINSRIVLQVSFGLTVAAMLLIYRLEHLRLLLPLPLGEQYLSAFFQAVTLRTAGFNTLPMETLGAGTLMLMIGMMFIGGAAGSTAGGIKVNTLGVVWAYIHSFRKGREDILLYRHQVSRDQVMQAFTVILFGLLSVFAVSFLLLLIEDSPPLPILFESVSAFATVGLSTGITGSFTGAGKLCLVVLMFVGRIGPLTLLSATAGKEKTSGVSYPETTILIG